MDRTIRKEDPCPLGKSIRGCMHLAPNGICKSPCQPVVEQCVGCRKAVEIGDKNYCEAYVDPAAQWRRGQCPFRPVLKATPEVKTKKANKPSKSAMQAAARQAVKQAREAACKNARATERARARANRDAAKRNAGAGRQPTGKKSAGARGAKGAK